jgi:leucyl aminopeptidase
LAILGFEGKPDQLATVPGAGSVTIVVGLGPATAAGAAQLCRAAAQGTRAARRHPAASLTVAGAALAADRAGALRAVVEGARLGLYEHLAYKSKPSPGELRSLTVVGDDGDAAAVEAGGIVADAVAWARDRVNQPGGELVPAELAKAAAALGEQAGFEVTIHNRGSIKALRMGGLLGVNRGSAQPPRFIEAVYRPEGDSRGAVALVGKGITFDSGGLWIKTGQGMSTMKNDMSGAAAVLAATAAAARLRLPVEVRAYVPATDNMTGPDATRPGDVLTLRNGKTIEVINTDAEGRLVLADALAYASESSPDAMIDLATLTGACKVSLGAKIAGVMGNHDGWLTQVEAAAGRTGEQVWRLPLPPEYRKLVDSPIADMKNVGGDPGALLAGLILQEFVGEGIPWAHLDIAGTAWSDADDAEVTKGGTGYGVRLLVGLLESFTAPGS